MNRISKLLLIVTIIPMLLLCACKTNNDDLTQMQVDLNPSVEFILNDKNRVVTVTALNDDGAVIVYNENFENLTADEAVKKFVTICKETGYLSASYDNNELTISLSCNKNQAKELYSDIKGKVEAFYTENNIKGNIGDLKTITTDDVKKKLEEIYGKVNNNLSKDEMLEKLAESREETKNILSTSIRNMYNVAKDYALEVYENEQISELLNNPEYSALYEEYKTKLNEYKTQVEDTINGYIQEKSGEYKEDLEKFLKDKQSYLSGILDNVLGGLLNNLQQLKDNLIAQQSALEESAKNVINEFKTRMTENIEQDKKALDDLLNSTEVQEIINQNRQNIESQLENFKVTYIDSFMEDYSTQIEEYEQSINALKESLKKSNK